jgi:hypothetical protein
MSTQNPTHGTKVDTYAHIEPVPHPLTSLQVTTDPAGRENPIVEAAGVITSDSLAAESSTQHGKFAENRDSAPSAVPSKSSTAANTDTSAATVLPAASDAAHRGDAGEALPTPKPKAAQSREHHPADTASHPAAHSTSKSTHPKTNPHHGSTKTDAEKQKLNEEHGHVPIAPSYVQTGHVARDDPHNKPHGKGLKEVQEFEGGDGKNASFTTDIGGERDPGRVAEQAFERANAVPGFEAGRRQKGVDGKGQYDALKDDE